LERFHELLANHRRAHFALASREEIALEIGSDRFHLALGNRALLTCLAQAVENFLAAVLLAAAVLLHDEEAWRFHSLVRRKAMLAARIQALAPPANHGFIIARIDDARLTLATGWTDQ